MRALNHKKKRFHLLLNSPTGSLGMVRSSGNLISHIWSGDLVMLKDGSDVFGKVAQMYVPFPFFRHSFPTFLQGLSFPPFTCFT